METQTGRNLELLEEACRLLNMESDAEDEEEEETEWGQISQCVEEMENLESVDSGPKDKKKAAALDRLEELFDKRTAGYCSSSRNGDLAECCFLKRNPVHVEISE